MWTNGPYSVDMDLNYFYFYKPYRLWLSIAPEETHLVLQSGLARKSITLSDPSLKYLPTIVGVNRLSVTIYHVNH